MEEKGGGGEKKKKGIMGEEFVCSLKVMYSKTALAL